MGRVSPVSGHIGRAPNQMTIRPFGAVGNLEDLTLREFSFD